MKNERVRFTNGDVSVNAGLPGFRENGIFRDLVVQFAGCLLDFVKPEFCPICETRLATYPSVICDKCRIDIDAERRIRHVQNVSVDRHLFVDESITLYPYETARKLILAAKYRKKCAILRHAGEYLGRWLVSGGASIDVVTCVPMRYAKIIKRGMNPSELIARSVARETGVMFMRTLGERVVSGEQKMKSREGRFAEIVGRFHSLRRDISGKSIALVDDVMTTGATLNECARLLKNAGAGRIISITIAEVMTKKLEKK